MLSSGYNNKFGLKDRNLNITSYLAQAIKVFENFKLMSGLRQELDKLKSPTVSLPPHPSLVGQKP